MEVLNLMCRNKMVLCLEKQSGPYIDQSVTLQTLNIKTFSHKPY